MYSAIIVYGGVINSVKMSNDLGQLKSLVIAEAVENYDIEDDCIQIWDDKGNLVFSYEHDVLELA